MSRAVLIACLVSALPLAAAAADASHERAFREAVKPFLQEHCVRCHRPEKQKSNVRLDEFSGAITSKRDADLWTDVLGMLALEEMPPAEEKQPSGAAREKVTAWIEAELRRAALAMQSTGGRVVLRRLNKREYVRTMSDLLLLPEEVVEEAAASFPPDGAAFGFDTVGAAHDITAVHLGKYQETARTLLDRALARETPLAKPFRYEMTPDSAELEKDKRYLKRVTEKGNTREVERMTKQNAEAERRIREHGPEPWWIRPRFDNLPRFVTTKRVQETFGEDHVAKVMRDADGKPIKSYNDFHVGSALSFPGSLMIPQDGHYRVTAKLGARDAHGGPLTFNLSVDKGRKDPNSEEFIQMNQWRALVDWQVDTPLADIARDHHESVVWLDRAKYGVWCTEPVTFQREVFRWGEMRGQVFLLSFAIEGPVENSKGTGKARSALFSRGDGKAGDEAYAREILSRFARRAFRRPPQEADLARLLGIATARWRDGASFEEGVREALVYALSSPSFLYLRESPAPGGGTEKAFTIDDHALACRLAYFLWGTMPDEQLFRLAEEGALRDSTRLRAEVERLLNDERATAFARHFTRQWLRLGELPVRNPSLEKYPDFDEHLRRSMLGETEAFFTEVLRGNLPLETFLRSDFAMLNERLAAHYGISGVKGDRIRRVPLDSGLQRSGLMGQAAVLMATSTDVRTSPVSRGAFVIKTLLGKSLPPPPPNVPDLEEVPEMVNGRPITVAERMEKHRSNDACRKCHQKIDPLGLAFENFDATGRWRADAGFPVAGGGRVAGSPIVAAGKFPSSGLSFAGPEEFKAALVKTDAERFVRAFTEQLLTYALGRGLEFTDEEAVTTLLRDWRARKGGLRDLVHLITESTLFARK